MVQSALSAQTSVSYMQELGRMEKTLEGRPRIHSLKPIKRLMAAGQHREAVRSLLAKRDQLLAVLGTEDAEEMNQPVVEQTLTIVNNLLGECYSILGDVDDSEEWFERAFLYYREDHDIVVYLRLRRMYAMHQSRLGKLSEALSIIESVIDRIHQLQQTETEIPPDRLELEFGYTLTFKAEIMLATDPASLEAVELLKISKPILRAGWKRHYELHNLLLCIKTTSKLRHPVRQQIQIARATFLNERYAHNNEVRLELLDAQLAPLPLMAAVSLLH